MRTFSLKDDCTLSGRRLHRDERRVEGGGYVDLASPPVPSGRSRPTGSLGEVPMECRQRARHALLPAHGVVLVRADGMKPGEVEVLAAQPPAGH